MKIAFLGNYTLDLLVRQFQRLSRNAGLEVQSYTAGFNQYVLEILNEQSGLYQFQPETIILTLDLRNLTVHYLSGEGNLRDGQFQSKMTTLLDELKNYLEMLRCRLPNSLILIDNFFLPPETIFSTLEYNSDFSQKEIEATFNLQLSEFTQKFKTIKVVDVHSLVLNFGYRQLRDNRLNYTAKMPWSQMGLEKLAGLYLRYLRAYLGLRKKCVVLDLDNTLWGGIVGDDGMEKIKLSNDGEGKAFNDFQADLLQLYQRGILLAICSKNTEDIALQAIETHPHMLLRANYFAARRINWQNKAENLQEIAAELNIGLDSLVFLDDSPHERALVREQLPQVTVPEMPVDPSDYSDFLRSLDYFDFLEVTRDDLNRNEMYQANFQREKLKESAVDMVSYYKSLEMVAYIGEANDFSQSRVAQLTQKTNQYNLTTRRYSETGIAQFRQNDRFKIFHLRLVDRFGDNGITGVAIIKIEKDAALIDSFLLSCRVMGRTVETAFLTFIQKEMKKNGIKYLVGEFIPTKKNMPCKTLYLDHKFQQLTENLWSLDLTADKIDCPEWIELKEETDFGNK